MRESELNELASVIEKRIPLPPDRANDLKRRVRATDVASRWALEFYERLMADALIDQEEAWDECAELAGFQTLDDMHEQGYVLSLKGSLLELRKLKEANNA